MKDSGYDLSEIFDESSIGSLADALGIGKDEVLAALMDALNSEFPDSDDGDMQAYAEALRGAIDEGWVTPENLDTPLDGEDGDGVDSNGNALEDEDDFDDGLEDDDLDDGQDEYDDGYDDYEDEDEDEEEEPDPDPPPPSDERVKDRKPAKGCVSDETVKNIVSALDSFLY